MNIFRTLAKRHILTFATACIFATPSFAASINSSSGFLNAVQNKETGSYSNPYAVNTGNGAYGAFQQRATELKQIGYMNADGSWNAKNSGAASLNDYLQCGSCQVAGETAAMKDYWRQLSANQATSLVGKTGADGNVYNESALLECAQQLGAAGCKKYVEGDPNELAYAANKNPHLAADIAAASSQDASAFTDGDYTQVDNSSRAAGGEMSAGTAEAAMATYCAKEIQEMMQQVGEQAIDNSTILASNSATGYSMLNGQGLMDNALKNGDVGTGGNLMGSGGLSSLWSTLGHAGYESASCLQNMISGLGITPLFTGINLNQIMDQIMNTLCSGLETQMSNLTQPAYSFLNSTTSKINSGGFLPGMNLGSTGFNLSFQEGGGQFGVGNASYNLNNLLNNSNSWYNKIGQGSSRISTGNSTLDSIVNGDTMSGESLDPSSLVNAIGTLSQGSSPF